MRSVAPSTTTTTSAVLPHGYVHIPGASARGYWSELEWLLRREEARAHRDSPAARILACDDDGSGGLLVATTTEHLAHRLGRSLQKTLGGEVHHGFGNCSRVAFVWWRR